ncbi:MAG TPA: D-glycero-beta-D-manno-heptose 1-phosphate adenylyltransferase [Gemmatimonadaceae bacterium]|nr:D-glycero-beta-D-manno-heptose 1-phosphate adenylyltransferase [Gemmatimonadaceae bacterium]
MRDPHEKIAASRSEAVERRAKLRGRVVFTNGVFDLLHPGHIDLLGAARAEGDALIVGINTDKSVTRLKGPSRPIRAERDRAYVLSALEAVDLVVSFDEDTPLEIVKALRPDVIVKGGDYTPDSIVGAKEVESWGGRVVVVPLTAGHSTTSIIESMTDND